MSAAADVPQTASPEPSAPPAAAEPSPAAAPEPRAPSTWIDSLDDDLRHAPSLGKFKSVGDLAKSYVNLETKIGQKGVILPKEGAPPEAWNEVYTALGRPDSPEHYDLGDWKAPENLGWDENFQQEAMGKFHEAGLSSKQAQALLGWYTERGMAEIDARTTERQQLIADERSTVSKKWGQAYEARADVVKRTFDTMFPEEAGDLIRSAVLPNGLPLVESLPFLAGMYAAGEHLSEHQLLGDREPIRFAATPEQATAEFEKLKYDKEFQQAFANPRHPNHKEALEKVRKLSEAIEGGIRSSENILVE